MQVEARVRGQRVIIPEAGERGGLERRHGLRPPPNSEFKDKNAAGILLKNKQKSLSDSRVGSNLFPRGRIL